jgi:histidinol-phosphatase
VTTAKMLASIDPNGAAIDMPAGPTEVVVIADRYARADFVAADLLAQAEHGPDSQVVLVCTNDAKIDEILAEVQRQLAVLPRRSTALKALDSSFALLVPSLLTAIQFANDYAPEHLVLNIKDARKLIPKIVNAGSVFIGPYSCESAGDYASGTNHSLPTYGYARSYSGISLTSFQKRITFQEVTPTGAAALGPTVATMAAEEGLDGHKRAMELRFAKLPQKYAFLDRDGTLIYEPPDTEQIDSIEKLQVLPGVIKGLQTLKRAGYKLVMVSNQDGLGTASFPRDDFDSAQNEMFRIFAKADIRFDQILICPHTLEDDCDCRKPKLGLFAGLGLFNDGSFVCGDRETDHQLATNLGIEFVPMETNGDFSDAIKTVKEKSDV